ncbi:succinate dehydrogenase, cytochrome b556 subunit [Amorphus sp. 3PC139-8]|uniref:succinate dehydrogenase, cytochrome b556 subunit n=1 Tax=Amorphus sp. 3PC139-8 TaxID=2735676 RepID=UPI00345D9812
MSHVDAKANRPLSPHLQVYRPIVTMVMSIMHRITGSALFFGTILLVWWLVAAATGPEAFAIANGFMGSWIGIILLFGFSWALIHHTLGGIRHFIWDTGRGFDEKSREGLAWATIIGSVSLTILLWIIGLIAI